MSQGQKGPTACLEEWEMPSSPAEAVACHGGPGLRVGIRPTRSGGVLVPAADCWWSAANIHCHMHALEGSSFYYGELESTTSVHSFSSFSEACCRAQSGTQQPRIQAFVHVLDKHLLFVFIAPARNSIKHLLISSSSAYKNQYVF